MSNVKKYSLIILVIFLVSCKSPYYTSANSMRFINGTIELKNGKQVNGPITSSLESYYNSNAFITITPNDSKAEKYYIADIKGISVRSNYYEPKMVDMGFGSREQVLFLKRLTKEDSRIGLYELYEQRSNSNRRGTYYTDIYTYYISAPGNNTSEVWNLEGRHLTPNFEDKMSAIVKDCLPLSEKISRKDKGYFYAQVSLINEKRIETMMNIIDEYNRCK